MTILSKYGVLIIEKIKIVKIIMFFEYKMKIINK